MTRVRPLPGSNRERRVPWCRLVAAAGLVVLSAGLVLAANDDLARRASWQTPTAVTMRDTLLGWLDAQAIDEEVKQQIRQRWDSAVELPADQVLQLLWNPLRAQELGAAGRHKVIEHWSLEEMVRGYEQLIESVYCRKMLRLTTMNGHWTTDSELPAAHP